MDEINRHGLRAAICSLLAAGALAAAPAMAHNDDVDQPDDTATTSATSSGTTYGYGAATAADSTTDADQSRSSATTETTDSSSSTGASSPSGTDMSSTSGSSTTDATGPNRADLYSTGQSSDAKSMSSDADQANRSQATRSGSSASPDVVWYVFPLTMQAQSDQMSKGCWVQLYSGDDFEGRYVSVVGPAQIREMGSPYGTGLNNWESAIVGPNATVTTYDGENFEDRNAVLRTGQRYPDLDDSKLGLFDDIESMKVECTQSAQPGR